MNTSGYNPIEYDTIDIRVQELLTLPQWDALVATHSQWGISMTSLQQRLKSDRSDCIWLEPCPSTTMVAGFCIRKRSWVSMLIGTVLNIGRNSNVDRCFGWSTRSVVWSQSTCRIVGSFEVCQGTSRRIVERPLARIHGTSVERKQAKIETRKARGERWEADKRAHIVYNGTSDVAAWSRQEGSVEKLEALGYCGDNTTRIECVVRGVFETL